jgi:hypothetical protein
MREIQLQILDSSNSSLGVIELENFQDFPLTLTKAIGDLNDFTQRKTTYSLDFDLPKTQNNNQILFGIANVNGVSNSLNLLGRKRCNILVDSVQIAYGFIRIYESKYKDSYKANFTGGNGDWVELLSNVYLNQLEWTAETNSGTINATETFSLARIDVINGLDSDTSDIIYPKVIRDTIAVLDSRYVRPQIYVRSIIKKMFAKIGYTVNSSFLDGEFMKGTTVGSTVYKGVTVDPNFIFTNSEERIDASRAEENTSVGFQIPYVIGNVNASTNRISSKLEGWWNEEVQDSANAFNSALSTYTAPFSGSYDVSLKLGEYRYAFDFRDNGDFTLLFPRSFAEQTIDVQRPPSIKILIVKNNLSSSIIDGEILEEQKKELPRDGKFRVNLLEGENITVWIEIKADGTMKGKDQLPYTISRTRFWLGLDSNLSVQPSSGIVVGDEYTINKQLAENVSCMELLQDFKIQYNLYFQPDFTSKSILIEPRDLFYQSIGSADNITDLVDLSKSYTVNSDRTYQRELAFKYAKDSKDGYLEEWQKINNRIYGEYIHNFGSNYIQGKRTVKLKLIAPTIQKTVESSNNFSTSVIRRKYNEEDEPKGINNDYSMRTFQIVQISSSFQTIALMEGYGGFSTYNDLQLTFNGLKGLFATYYAKTMANIEDKRQVDLYLKMPLYKFRNLNFSKPVYIDFTIPELQGYYIYEQVKGYKLDEFTPVKVRLLRFKSYTPVVVDPSQKTNINQNTSTGQGETFEQIQYVFNEGTGSEILQDVFDTNNSGSLLPLYYD